MARRKSASGIPSFLWRAAYLATPAAATQAVGNPRFRKRASSILRRAMVISRSICNDLIARFSCSDPDSATEVRWLMPVMLQLSCKHCNAVFSLSAAAKASPVASPMLLPTQSSCRSWRVALSLTAAASASPVTSPIRMLLRNSKERRFSVSLTASASALPVLSPIWTLQTNLKDKSVLFCLRAAANAIPVVSPMLAWSQFTWNEWIVVLFLRAFARATPASSFPQPMNSNKVCPFAIFA
mmetsp:Transcript_77792/g.154299  ORF Transcript_77792/g.154299 Transcript_77792/m.154299 type:complete len:240 (-) Transcript_77792:89-808(-)